MDVWPESWYRVHGVLSGNGKAFPHDSWSCKKFRYQETFFEKEDGRMVAAP